MSFLRGMLGWLGASKPTHQKVYVEMDIDDRNNNNNNVNNRYDDISDHDNGNINNNNNRYDDISDDDIDLLINNGNNNVNNRYDDISDDDNGNINKRRIDTNANFNGSGYDDDDEENDGTYMLDDFDNTGNDNRNDAINREQLKKSRMYDILLTNESKKRKKAFTLIKETNTNPKYKQRSKVYNTLEAISAKSQVPLNEVTQMRKILKNNNNIVPEVMDVPIDKMQAESIEWNQVQNDTAIDMLIANSRIGQRNPNYLSSSAIAGLCNISQRTVKSYKEVLKKNGFNKFSAVEPTIGRPKAKKILSEDIVVRIRADRRIKLKGASDETTIRVIFDAMKSDAAAKGRNTFAITEPVYDSRLKQEMNDNGFYTDRQAQAKTKARLDASGDFFSMISAGAMFYMIAYEVPLDDLGNPSGAVPIVHKRRINPNLICNADMTSIMFGYGIGDTLNITIDKERLKNLESVGLSGVFNRSTDSNNTQRRSIGLYPTVTLRGDLVVAVF